MGQLNAKKAAKLLKAIEGDSIQFSPEEIQESRKRYAAACEKSEINERFRRARSIEKSSRIYLTF